MESKTNKTEVPQTEAVAVQSTEIETRIPSITPGLTFNSKPLQIAYDAIKAGADKAAASVISYGQKADAAREAFERMTAKALARLPRKGGKLDSDKCDGIKTVGEFGERIGMKPGKANALANYGAFLEDPAIPDEAKRMTWTKFAEIQSAYKKAPEKVIQAVKENTISASTPQRELGEWAKSVTTKNGTPKLVTLRTIDSYPVKGLMLPQGMTPDARTAEDWDALFDALAKQEHTEMVKLPAVKVKQEGKELKGDRYLLIEHPWTSAENVEYKARTTIYVTLPQVKQEPKEEPKQDTARYDQWTAARKALSDAGVSDEMQEQVLRPQYPEFYPEEK